MSTSSNEPKEPLSLEIDPESPWAHEAEAIAAATRANAELGYSDALDLRGAQQEAAEDYCAKEAQGEFFSKPPPWARPIALAEQAEYKERRDRQGCQFREVQQEAQKGYVASEQDSRSDDEKR